MWRLAGSKGRQAGSFWWTYVIVDFIISCAEYSRGIFICYCMGLVLGLNKVPFVHFYGFFSLYLLVYLTVDSCCLLRVALFSFLSVVLFVFIALCLFY